MTCENRACRVQGSPLTAGKQVKCKSLLDVVWTHRRNDSVSCIISSGATSAHIGLSGKHVYEFALSLVTPLGAEDYGYCRAT